MRYLLLSCLALAAAGFILSVTAHIFGLLGKMPPGGELVMSLHMGIFIVWMPTVLVAGRATKWTNRNDFWKIALAGCPGWMRYTLYGLFGYAIVNFVLFAIVNSDVHHATKEVSPETVRGFSGHWMVFYAAAFATLYSVTRSPQLLREHKCSNGHIVSPADAYCPTCGAALPNSMGFN